MKAFGFQRVLLAISWQIGLSNLGFRKSDENRQRLFLGREGPSIISAMCLHKVRPWYPIVCQTSPWLCSWSLYFANPIPLIQATPHRNIQKPWSSNYSTEFRHKTATTETALFGIWGMGFVENFGNLWKPGVYGGHIISNILEKKRFYPSQKKRVTKKTWHNWWTWNHQSQISAETDLPFMTECWGSTHQEKLLFEGVSSRLS